MFQPGGRVRDYEVIDKVKSGGMATLYLARRDGARGFSRPVGIKVIHPHLSADPEFVQMFVDEAVLSSRLIHPNIVHVEEFGEEEGHYFLVMEYVDGCSLSELMRFLRRKRKRLKPPLAVHVGMKVADGLHAAHEATDDDDQLLNVVHRDVGPANILLSRKGQIKTIDFGIAKSKVRTKQTDTSSLKGKIRYMSPEQANGKSIDRRTDVYSLALVLWELLTSRRLFRAETDIALLDKVRKPQIPDIAQYLKNQPALAKVITKALSFNPDDRYPSALEFRRALATACPEALRVESSDIGTLVRNVPTDQLRATTSASQHTPPSQVSLPSAVASPVSFPPDASNPTGEFTGAPTETSAPHETPSTAHLAVAAESGDRNKLLIVGAVAAAAVVLIGIIAFTGGGDPPEEVTDVAGPSTPAESTAETSTAEPEPETEAPAPTQAAAEAPAQPTMQASAPVAPEVERDPPRVRGGRPYVPAPRADREPEPTPTPPAQAETQTMSDGVRVRGSLLAGEDAVESQMSMRSMRDNDSVRVSGALLATDDE